MTLGALTSTLWTLVLQKRLHRFDIKKNFFNHSRPPKHSPEAQYHHANAAHSLLTLHLLAKAQELCSVPQRREANVDCASAWLGYAKDFERRLNTKMGTQWFFNPTGPTENMLVIWLSKTSLFFSNASFFFNHSRLISRNFTSLFVPCCSYQNSPILRICPSFNRQTWDHHARWRQQPLLAMGYLTTHKFKNVIQSLVNHHKSSILGGWSFSILLISFDFDIFWPSRLAGTAWSFASL